MLLIALCVFALAYRYYAAFLAAKVLALDPGRTTPAVKLNDGHDYHPTNKWVLFGHHFAAIAGAGPLVGPVLAAQFGFLPGAVWIIIGAVLAGAVHDYVILFASVRHNGLSLHKIARDYVGRTSGIATRALTGPFHQDLVRARPQAMGVPANSRIRVTVDASLTVNRMAWKSSDLMNMICLSEFITI